MNTSRNIIYNNLKTIELFSLPLINGKIPDDLKSVYIEDILKLKNNGLDINFTIDELENVLNNLKLRGGLLTFEQKEKRKKIIINLKNILLSEKIKDIKDNFIKSYLEDPLNAIDGTQKTLLNKQNIKENINVFHTLLLNTLDLFKEDIEYIEDISNNIIPLTIKKNNEELIKKNEELIKKNEEFNTNTKISNNMIIILIILLVFLFFLYLNK
jgi:hypothetical protein